MDEQYELTLLRRAAASIAYPATPQLRGRVLAAIATPAGRQAPPRRPLLAFATIAAAVALFGAMIALSIPSSRGAIADFFGIEGSDVEILPFPAPGATATPFPTATDLAQFARRVSLDAIGDAVGFDVALPRDGHEPRAAYVARYGPQAVAIIRYDGFDLWEAQLRTGLIAGKEVAPGTRIEELMLQGGVPARWITGAPHLLALETADGVEIESSIRTVRRSTLIWRTGHAFYRIETDRSLDDAIKIANSLP
jgi:hypothetical protein